MTKIIKESSVRWHKFPAIPPFYLSARYWCWRAKSTKADVQLDRISQYDPMIFTDPLYRPDVITPQLDLSSADWSPRWWLETTSTSRAQSIKGESQLSTVVVKVEPGTEEEVKPPKTDGEIESAGWPGEGDKDGEAQDEETGGEEDEETLDGLEDEARKEQKKGGQTPGLSEKAKGKQRAIETPPPPPQQSALMPKVIERKRKAARPVEDEEEMVEVSMMTKRVNKATEKDIGGGSGGKELKRRVDDDENEEDLRPAKKARTRHAKTPVVEADDDQPASPCPRCARIGTQCVNSPGRACKACNKSKVKCPLFTGRRRQKAPTVPRDKSVAATVASFQYDEDHEFYIDMADVGIPPSPRPRQRSKSRAKSVKASASRSGLEGGREPTELKTPKTPAPKPKSARQSGKVAGESSRRGKSSHTNLAERLLT